MSNLIDTLKEITVVRSEADKKCSELFCTAIEDPTALTDNWPPKDVKIISDEELQARTYHVKETDMPWLIFGDIDLDKMTKEETTGLSFADIDYAAKEGFVTQRIMTRRLQGDADSMQSDLSKVRDMMKNEVGVLRDEVLKQKAEYVSNIGIYAHAEGSMLTIFMACIIASKPTKEQVDKIKMSELHTRMMDLLKALVPLKEGETEPNVKDWEWELTKEDAVLAVQMMSAGNPGSEVLNGPEDLLKLTLMGPTVGSVDAKETLIKVKLIFAK